MQSSSTFSTSKLQTNTSTTHKCLKLQQQPVIQCHQHESNEHGRFFFTDNTLLIVLNGALNIFHGDQQNCVQEHHMAFMRKNTMIEFQTQSMDQSRPLVEWIIFTITHELATEYCCLTQPVVTNAQNMKVAISSLKSSTALYVTALKDYFKSMASSSQIFIKLKLLELLCCLNEEDPTMLQLLVDLRRELRPDFTTVLENHLTEPLSIRELAILCGRSLSSFRRDFYSIYNMSPSQWIREKRLLKAEEFLRNTRLPVTDICYTMGFENIAHFSRLFKSKFGRSPSAYRMERKVA